MLNLKPPSLLTLTFAAFGLLIACSGALAQTSVSVDSNSALIGWDNDAGIENRRVESAPGGKVSVETSAFHPAETATGAGSATHGVLQARGTADTTRSYSGAYSLSSNNSRWKDTLTFSAPGRAGRLGKVLVKVHYRGKVTTTGRNDQGSPTRANAGFSVRLYKFGFSPDTTHSPDLLKQQTYQAEVGFVFGEPCEFEVTAFANMIAESQAVPGSAAAEFELSWGGIVRVREDESFQEVTDYTLSSASGIDYRLAAPRSGQLWAAGRDLAANEKPDGAAEGNATNQKVAQWSYGYRTAVAGQAFVAFTPQEHINAFESEEVEGFSIPANGLLVAANTGSADVLLSGESQPAQPLLPAQMLLHPGSDGRFPVVRWTAPEAGTYNIAARWRDLDASSGNGASAHVVENGNEIAGRPAPFGASAQPGGFTGFAWKNGGAASLPPQSRILNAGDTVDFVLTSNGDNAADLTAFTAVVRRAPDVTLAAPATAAAGQDVVVTVADNPALKAVALRVNSLGAGTDTTPPFEFPLRNLTPGVYHIEAEGIDASNVRGTSNVLQLTVTDAASAGLAQRSGAGTKGDVRAASSGSTYECVLTGSWSQADIWRRQSDGAPGVPGPEDVAIIPYPQLVTLTENVTVKKLFSSGRLVGSTTNPDDRTLTVTEHFEHSGYLGDMTVDIAERCIFTNSRGIAFGDNTKIINRGQMALTRGFFAGNSSLTSTGSISLLTPPGSGGPTIMAAKTMELAGRSAAAPGGEYRAEAGLVGPDGASVISDNGLGLVGPDGASLVGPDGASLVGPDGASAISENGAGLVGPDGASLVGPDGASLVGPDGASIGFVPYGSFRPGTGSAAFRHNAQQMAEGQNAGAAAAAGGRVTLEAGATLAGNVNVIGSLLNRGFVLPGNSAGAVRVAGDYTQEQSGTLLLEVGGTQPSQYDQLQVVGTANLNGKLIVKTIGGFNPQSGHSFAPLTYGSASGSFSSVTSNAQVSFGASGMSMQVSGPNPPAPKALNIATRMRVETGDNVLIAGFIVTGDQPKRVLIRGIGPSLPVAGALADPTLDLDGGAVFNDDWRSNQEEEINATTIPPQSDLESAIVATLEPGLHTAVLRGKNEGTGVGLVEVYDLESGAPAQLANISTRGQVQTGDNVMIGGFIIGGDYPAKVLLRAIGPSLPVDGAMQDPTLELVDGQGNTISNDNWRATQEAEIIATTVPPANDREAAIVATLVPGAYTAIVRGKDNTIGVALVEGYNLQ